jgi:hypothetical protein
MRKNRKNRTGGIDRIGKKIELTDAIDRIEEWTD